MSGQASRPRIAVLISLECLGVTMKLGFSREDLGEEETCGEDHGEVETRGEDCVEDVPGRCPPLKLMIELVSADVFKISSSPSAFAVCSLYLGVGDLSHC